MKGHKRKTFLLLVASIEEWPLKCFLLGNVLIGKLNWIRSPLSQGSGYSPSSHPCLKMSVLYFTKPREYYLHVTGIGAPVMGGERWGCHCGDKNISFVKKGRKKAVLRDVEKECCAPRRHTENLPLLGGQLRWWHGVLQLWEVGTGWHEVRRWKLMPYVELKDAKTKNNTDKRSK